MHPSHPTGTVSTHSAMQLERYGKEEGGKSVPPSIIRHWRKPPQRLEQQLFREKRSRLESWDHSGKERRATWAVRTVAGLGRRIGLEGTVSPLGSNPRELPSASRWPAASA